MSKSMARLVVVWFFLSHMLVGCVNLPGEDRMPGLQYTLTPKNTFDSNLPTVNKQISVEKPFAAAGLDTTRIAVLETPLKFNYVADANWIDRLPVLIQTLLIETLENTSKVKSVGRASAEFKADYIIRPEIREFQLQTWADTPNVVVRLNLKLIRIPDRNIVASQSFESTISVPHDPSIHVVAQSLDEALGRVLKDCTEWVLYQISD